MALCFVNRMSLPTSYMVLHTSYIAHHFFKAKATYLSPEGLRSFPPPQAIATNCLPFTAYVEGEANPGAGSTVSQSNLPVLLSKALNFLSGVAAIKIKPLAVTSGPP